MFLDTTHIPQRIEIRKSEQNERSERQRQCEAETHVDDRCGMTHDRDRSFTERGGRCTGHPDTGTSQPDRPRRLVHGPCTLRPRAPPHTHTHTSKKRAHTHTCYMSYTPTTIWIYGLLYA